MSESAIERQIVAYAQSRGFLSYKFSSPNHKGVPDRIFVTPYGRTLYLEVKAPGKKPTALQERELRKLQDHGAPARWVDNAETGKAWIDINSTP